MNKKAGGGDANLGGKSGWRGRPTGDKGLCARTFNLRQGDVCEDAQPGSRGMARTLGTGEARKQGGEEAKRQRRQRGKKARRQGSEKARRQRVETGDKKPCRFLSRVFMNKGM